MRCPVCGEWSTVLDTRPGPSETIKRRRECGNGHRFFTFEMLGPARNPGQTARALATVKARRAKWERDQRIRRDPRPRAVVAAAYGITKSTVSDIRTGRR